MCANTMLTLGLLILKLGRLYVDWGAVLHNLLNLSSMMNEGFFGADAQFCAYSFYFNP